MARRGNSQRMAAHAFSPASFPDRIAVHIEEITAGRPASIKLAVRSLNLRSESLLGPGGIAGETETPGSDPEFWLRLDRIPTP
jgi:hypothetical protein